jgi:hypothetical protein
VESKMVNGVEAEIVGTESFGPTEDSRAVDLLLVVAKELEEGKVIRVPSYRYLGRNSFSAPFRMWSVRKSLVGQKVVINALVGGDGRVIEFALEGFVNPTVESKLLLLDKILSETPFLTSGGPWLGACRDWIKCKVRNGERVTWGSLDRLECDFTVSMLESLAQTVAVAMSRRIEEMVQAELNLCKEKSY